MLGENVTRFNTAENERLVREENNDPESGSHNSGNSENCSKIIIRKSIIGSQCSLEYDFSGTKQKTTQITNSIIQDNVKIFTGCIINNCIIARGATIGEKELLTFV